MYERRNSAAGFTSIELLVAMVILAILSYSGVNQYMQTLGAFKRMSALNQFESDMRRARIESITQGGRGLVLESGDGHGYRIGIDYFPFASTPIIETQLFASDFGDEIGFDASDEIIFNSRGFLVDETGLPTTITFEFTFRGEPFCNGSIYSSGVLELDCR